MCSVEKRGNIFVLTLTSNNEKDEHRLNPTLITSIRSALADIRSQASSSSSSSSPPMALVTTSTGKFYSNGFDLKLAQSSGDFVANVGNMVESFKPLVADFLSLPMPTIAAVTGHAAAAGFALALSHDYLFMSKDRGVLYMSELDIGMTFPEYFNVLFREKVDFKARREIMMKGRKLKAEEGVELGVVDQVFAQDQVFQKAVEFGEELIGRKWNGQVYAEIRKGLYPLLCKELQLTRTTLVVPRL